MYAAILLVLKFLFALMYCVCDRYFVRKRRNRKRLQSIGSWRRLEESTTSSLNSRNGTEWSDKHYNKIFIISE